MKRNSIIKSLSYLIVTLLLSGSLGMSMEAKAQKNNEVTVSGTVIDGTIDEPFIGVTIQAIGTTLGTTTDLNGHFTIKVPDQVTLSFSFIGYKPKQVKVNGATSDLKVVLQEDTQALEELVVIGYGSSRKEDLSTSISTMNIDESLKSRPANLANMLQGRMPGVTIQNNGGNPMKGAELNIRGKGSRGGDQVLYVVDGVPGAPFNIEDVENITVLKDASSAAIYGASVGSGGVIVVTTKKAKEGNLHVDINSSYSFDQITKKPQVTTAGQYIKVWNKVVENGDAAALPAVANVSLYPYGMIDRTNWMDEIFRLGSMKHVAASISGGSERLSALFSVSYDRHDGILKNTWSDGFGARLNADFTVNKWLKLSQSLHFTHDNGQGGNINDYGHEGILADATFYPTAATIYEMDENGKEILDAKGNKVWGGTIPAYYAKQGISGYGMINNPVASLFRLHENQPASTLFSTTSLNIKPLYGLDIISRLSLGEDWGRYEGFTPAVREVGGRGSQNSRSIYNSLHNRWIWETTATYARVFGDDHHISAMAGYTMQYDNWRDNWVEGTELPSEDLNKIILSNATKIPVKPTEGIVEESMISGFGRIAYSYADRYFFTASVRNDLSSKLDPSHRSAVFPAVSGSWKISSEDFMKDMDAINLLKIRASWGQVGSVATVNPYAYNVSMAQARQTVFGIDNHTVTGYYQRGISNTDLRWETTESWGVGLDLGLFDRLSLTVDYFHKLTKDLIERVPIVSTMGVEEEPLGNVGSVLNKGWEFQLNYNDRSGDFTWGGFANMSIINSEVLDLGSRDYIQDNLVVNGMSPIRSKVGLPWQSFYLQEADGIFKSNEEVAAYTHKDPETGAVSPIQPNAKAGDIKFVDQNNDGVINTKDYKYFGSYMPKFTFSFGANFGWNGVDLSLDFQGIQGNQIYNAYKQMTLTGRGVEGNMNALVMKSFDFDPNSGIPRIGVAKDENGNYSSANSYFLEDGSYLRLKNMTLGYTLPKVWMEAISMPRATVRFYLNGSNLITFTKYSGIDPEVGRYGVDAGRYPLSRTFSLGLNLSL